MFVLDTAAILAVVLDEPDAAEVHAAIPATIVSAVNLSAVYAKRIDRGAALDTITTLLDMFILKIGSFGDRACLALGQQRGATILTSDGRFAAAGGDLGIDIRMIG